MRRLPPVFGYVRVIIAILFGVVVVVNVVKAFKPEQTFNKTVDALKSKK